jgi:hypothetical protein
VRSAVIRSATAPMEAPRRSPVIVDPVRIGAFEQRLGASEIRDFQRVACLTPDGKFTATTREAILNWLKSNNVKDANFPDRITLRDATRLRDALDDGPRC